MPNALYALSFALSFAATLILLLPLRRLAVRWGVMDYPSSPVKTHEVPTPYLGGVGIFGGVAMTLLVVRFFTHFPSGTLRSLRAILAGGLFMAGVGLVDDVKSKGLDFRWKFVFQIIGALLLVLFDIRIKFVEPTWLAVALTILWVVGITNAFNIIDIMDGLSASQAFVASLGFLFISLPTEEIYVNVCAAAVAGATLAFLPFNHSADKKMFMGDAGSLFLGFGMAALSLGTSYTRVSEVGLLSPLLILGLPIYDTFFVSVLRIKQGKSPFLGSKDHLALKLRSLGLASGQVVAVLAAAAVFFNAAAYWVTVAPFHISLFVFPVVMIIGLYVVVRLHRVHVP